MSITQYITAHGTLMIHKHRLLQNSPQAGAGGPSNAQQYGFMAIAVEPSQLRKRAMPGRDTQLQENIQNNDDDKVKHQFFSEVGWEIRLSKLHGVLKNVTG
jgi:hypothetical protein